MAKRLEKLHVDSIDLVDKGAGVGTRIMIAKRDPAVTFAKDGHRWKLAADGDLTDKLIQAAPALGLAVDVAKRTWDLRDPRGKLISSHHSRKDAKRAMRRHRAAARGESADSDTWRADDSLAKAKAEIKANKRFLKENPVMDTQIDIAKAEAITKRFADRVDEIARANFISHQSATMRLASTSALISKSDAELWASYRAASQLIADNRPAPVVAAPVPQVRPHTASCKSAPPNCGRTIGSCRRRRLSPQSTRIRRIVTWLPPIGNSISTNRPDCQIPMRF
jgi:hypothetical protein